MKTTSKQFNLFVSECKKWIKIFELNGWNITYYHEELTPSKHIAQCSVNLEGRTINLSLNIISPDDYTYTNEEIKSFAKHECIHALLGRFSVIGQSRYITSSEMYEAEEELVYKLVKIINK